MTFAGKTVEEIRDALPDGALDFFAVFSAFEAAAKGCGFLKSRIEGRRAEVSWSELAAHLDGLSQAESGSPWIEWCTGQLSDAAILRCPPKKQIITKGRPDFGKSEPLTSTQSLLEAVALVRNNLFHGGKYPSGLGESRDRNERLLKDGMAIIAIALDTSADLQAALKVAIENTE